MKFHPLLESQIENKDHYKTILTQAHEERLLLFAPQAPEIALAELDVEYPSKERLGLYSEDISSYWTPTMKQYIEGNIASYKEGVELYSERIGLATSLIEKLKNIFLHAYAHIRALSFIQLSTPWTTWLWVLDSLDTISFDIAREKAKKHPRNKQPDQSVLAKEVTYEERLQYVKEHYYELTPYMWVSKTDVGVIIYDPKAKPYTLRDGWTFDQVGEIFSEWFYIMTDEHIHSEVRYDEISWE